MLKMAASRLTNRHLDLTAGEMGTRGTPETRAKEAAAAVKILKVKYRDTLAYLIPTSNLRANTNSGWPPPFANSAPHRHSSLTGKLAHPDPLPRLNTGLRGLLPPASNSSPSPASPFRPQQILYSTAFTGVRPTFVVDITAQFEQRHKGYPRLFLAVRPTFRLEKDKRLTWPLTAGRRNEPTRRHYGDMIGVRYGRTVPAKRNE